MMRKNLKKMTKSYTKQYAHDMRRNGIKHALVVMLCGFGFGVLVGVVAPENELQHNPKDKNFIQKLASDRNAHAPMYAGILFAILAYLFAELELVGIRHESKSFALTIIKRYMHDVHINVSNVDENVLYDVADLIIGNMTKGERAKINNIGLVLDAKINATPITDKLAQNKAISWAKDEMSKVIDSVFIRCPTLEALVLDMLSGKVKYNKFMANTNYQTNKYQK
jgi:hypothetical protein